MLGVMGLYTYESNLSYDKYVHSMPLSWQMAHVYNWTLMLEADLNNLKYNKWIIRGIGACILACAILGILIYKNLNRSISINNDGSRGEVTGKTIDL